MITTTWELHFEAPRSPAHKLQVEGDLGRLKSSLTQMRMDWDLGEDLLSVMIGDTEALQLVLMDLVRGGLRLQKVTCQFSESTIDGTAHGTLVLDEDEDENSEIRFPPHGETE
jgi:hypothetical protein